MVATDSADTPLVTTKELANVRMELATAQRELKWARDDASRQRDRADASERAVIYLASLLAGKLD